MTHPRLIATFRPQRWVGDVAMDVDGQQDFDATAAYLSLSNEKIISFKENDYDSDELANICNVGNDHDGPIEVDVDIDEWLAKLGFESGRAGLSNADIERLREMFEPQPRYTKDQDSDALDDGWTIKDENGYIVAHLDTEAMADAILELLG